MNYVVPGLLGVCLCAATILFGAVELHYFVVIFGAAMLLALIWVGKLFFARTATWKPSPMHWPVLGFVVYTFIHYFLSPYEYLTRMELFQVCLFALVYFIAANNVNRGRERTIVIAMLLLLATLEAMYGIWQGFTESNSVLHMIRPRGYSSRASGTYVCPNHLAGFLEMILGFALARLAIYRPPERDSIESQVLHKVMVGYAVLAIIAGILFSLSRGGWFSTVIGMVVFLVWNGIKHHFSWRPIAIGVAAVCVFGLLLFSVPKARYHFGLMLTPKDQEKATILRDTSLNGRTPMWAATWRIIQDNPIFGTGAGTWQWVHPKYRESYTPFQADYAHNDILQMTADYGVVGFALAAITLGCFFWQARRLTVESVTSEQRAFVVGAVVGISILLVHSWFDFNLHIPANGLLFCAILGLVAGMQIPEGPWGPQPMKPAMRYLLACGLLVAVAAGVAFVWPAAQAVRYAELGNRQKDYLQWDEAIDYYERAISCDPKYIRPRTKLGDIYFVQAKFRIGEEKEQERLELARKAVEHYKMAFELNKSRADVLAKLASAYELAGEADLARKCFDTAGELDPFNLTIKNQYAIFLRKIGDNKKALEVLEFVEKISMTDTTVINLWELRHGTPAD